MNLLNSVFHIWWQLRGAAVVAPYRNTTVSNARKRAVAAGFNATLAAPGPTQSVCLWQQMSTKRWRSFQTSNTIVNIVSRRQLSMPHCNAQNKKNNLLSLEKKVEKAVQFVEKKVSEGEVKTPENVRKKHSEDCSTGIRIQNVPEIASQKSAQRLQHDMKHVMAILKHTIGEEPTISDCFRFGKYDETKRRGIIVKLSPIWTTRKILANSHHMVDYPADYRAFISGELTHE